MNPFSVTQSNDSDQFLIHMDIGELNHYDFPMKWEGIMFSCSSSNFLNGMSVGEGGVVVWADERKT